MVAPADHHEPRAMRPLTIGELLDTGMKIYTRRFVPLMAATAVIILPVLIFTSVVQISTLPDDFLGLDDFTQQLEDNPEVAPTFEVDSREILSLVGGTFVATVVSLVGGQLATAATIHITAGAYLDEKPDWKKSIRFAFRMILPLVGVILLTTFGSMLGLILCIIPGVYLWVKWSVVTPALILEEPSPGVFGSLRRSWRLTDGLFFPTFVVLLVAVAAQMAVASVLGAFSYVGLFAGSFVVTLILQFIASAIATLVTTPFYSAVLTALYFDLRVRNEGYDLEILARSIGAEGFVGSSTLPATSPPFSAGPPPGFHTPPYSPPPPAPPGPYLPPLSGGPVDLPPPFEKPGFDDPGPLPDSDSGDSPGSE